MKETCRCFSLREVELKTLERKKKNQWKKVKEEKKNKEHRKRVLVLRRDTSLFDKGREEVLMGVYVPYFKNYLYSIVNDIVIPMYGARWGSLCKVYGCPTTMLYT